MNKDELINKWKLKLQNETDVKNNALELYSDILLYAVENSTDFELVKVKSFKNNKEVK